ncbi:hypothetical protein AVEN_263918-1 [Araneus ventricosus]|uniref:Uncharacterized protein n=1 Tax=Araneus ventricosus TaxID=182803 RepID=A0A4Y2NG28_ARAVE|nr:hypothetical protein AVEN_263918-1 [Araneus ventricosus]
MKGKEDAVVWVTQAAKPRPTERSKAPLLDCRYQLHRHYLTLLMKMKKKGYRLFTVPCQQAGVWARIQRLFTTIAVEPGTDSMLPE